MVVKSQNVQEIFAGDVLEIAITLSKLEGLLTLTLNTRIKFGN